MGKRRILTSRELLAFKNLRDQGETIDMCCVDLGISRKVLLRVASQYHLNDRYNKGQMKGTDVIKGTKPKKPQNRTHKLTTDRDHSLQAKTLCGFSANTPGIGWLKSHWDWSHVTCLSCHRMKEYFDAKKPERHYQTNKA